MPAPGSGYISPTVTDTAANRAVISEGYFVLKLSSMKVEFELRSYCQRWLSLLSEGEFDQACEMISAPNKYGVRWCKEEIIESTADYFGDLKDFAVQNMDIADCTPEFLACDDGS